MHNSRTGPRGKFLHKLSTKLVCNGRRSLQCWNDFIVFIQRPFLWSVGGEFPDNKSHLLSGSASWHQTKYFPTFQLRFSSLSHLHLLNSLSISRLLQLSHLFALIYCPNVHCLMILTNRTEVSKGHLWGISIPIKKTPQIL